MASAARAKKFMKTKAAPLFCPSRDVIFQTFAISAPVPIAAISNSKFDDHRFFLPWLRQIY
jgi:hypothetical protein